MYDDSNVQNGELADLIVQQLKLASKAINLTSKEMWLFRLLGTRMEELLNGNAMSRRSECKPLWRTPIVPWIYLN